MFIIIIDAENPVYARTTALATSCGPQASKYRQEANPNRVDRAKNHGNTIHGHSDPEEQARQARQPGLNLPNTKDGFEDHCLLFRRRSDPSVHHELKGHSIDSLKHGRASKSGNCSGQADA